MGEEGELFISIPLGHFPPLAAAILGSPESRGMVKLGNVAPKGMCEAVGPRLQGEDSWFTPYKIKLQLGKEQPGRFIRRWRGRLLEAVTGGVEAMAQGLFCGSLGLARVKGRPSVSSAPGLWLPLRRVGPGVVRRRGRMDLQTWPGILALCVGKSPNLPGPQCYQW